ncbi:MAG: NAD(+) diphosphatase [Boseongicola sp. SB0677_bin_26]|nr:NAD(+) diphosphatase [Boseongicola sp. SB0665_bin_10]MYG27392.1 NAD(+) diphosphatase [Boseongicola sp. SB0677_bin_26]
MQCAESVTFGGSGLDRAVHLRADPPGGFVLPLWRGKPLLAIENRRPVFLPADHQAFNAASEPAVFLGLDEGEPRFARDISDWLPEGGDEGVGAFNDTSEQQHPELANGCAFADLRQNMTRLSVRDAELVVIGKALLEWHRAHRFCARCSAPSRMAMAGWQRNCPVCEGQHFPRTDPVVIMLITSGNSVLMGRSGFWPERMYSLLAGFMEPGETIEAAVRREVGEEAGIEVGEVRYLASQPWPFPSSLMIGCHGIALTDSIRIQADEIEDAKWVTREEMMQVLAGDNPGMTAARKGSIARFLIEGFLADRLALGT